MANALCCKMQSLFCLKFLLCQVEICNFIRKLLPLLDESLAQSILVIPERLDLLIDNDELLFECHILVLCFVESLRKDILVLSN